MGLENTPHKVSYRKIKYPRIEFTCGKLHFILPLNYRHDEVFRKHERWIQKKLSFIHDCLKESEKRELIDRSKDEFKGLVLSLVIKVAEELNLRLNNIIFRFMKTKWASLSAKKILLLISSVDICLTICSSILSITNSPISNKSVTMNNSGKLSPGNSRIMRSKKRSFSFTGSASPPQ